MSDETKWWDLKCQCGHGVEGHMPYISDIGCTYCDCTMYKERVFHEAITILRSAVAERDAQLALLGDKLDAETEENNELSRAFTLASENMNNAECQLADARQELAEAQREIARCVERSANAVHDAIDEHEASICPEDVGCAELIASLERQLAEARRELDARPVSGMLDLLAEARRERNEARKRETNREIELTALSYALAEQLREADAVIEACVAVIWQNADDDDAALRADAWREETKEAAWRVFLKNEA